jgi:hypothetical protein
MKPQTFLILFSLTVLALALIPLTAAQESNMLTDAFSGFTEWASGIGSQASTFIQEQPIATGTITTLGAGTGIGVGGWAIASKGKKAAESLANNLSQKLGGAESQASNALGELSSYKTQAETQLSTFQTEAQKQLEAAKTQASNATSQLGGLQDKVTDLTQQKASLQNEKERLEQLVHDWQIKYEAVKPQVK